MVSSFVHLLFSQKNIYFFALLLAFVCRQMSNYMYFGVVVFSQMKTVSLSSSGAVGYMGTSAFVRKIYTNVKID